MRTCGLGLTTLPHSAPRVMSSPEAKLIYQKYDEMMDLLRKYREKIFQDWVAGVDQDCDFNLGQPLIQRDRGTNLVRVNFSKAVGVSGRRPGRRPPGPRAPRGRRRPVSPLRDRPASVTEGDRRYPEDPAGQVESGEGRGQRTRWAWVLGAVAATAEAGPDLTCIFRGPLQVPRGGSVGWGQGEEQGHPLGPFCRNPGEEITGWRPGPVRSP